METILIIDDDEDLRWNLSEILKGEGYETIALGNARKALKVIKRNSPNLILSDIKLPGMDGMELLKEVKKTDRHSMIIMLTAYANVKETVKAMKLGAFDYITKPFDNEELLLIVKKALQAQYLTKEVEYLRKRLAEKTAIKELMGESPNIKQVLKQVEIIAPTNMTVILQGESGSGKEFVTNMIHEKSPRRDKPFIAVDCGAIPQTLIESELFGYEKGAFTGADVKKEGRFEQADGGTLLLDEIGNLPEAAQAKLLRVIEGRTLQPLGGRKHIKIDVRIIVATITNLSEAVRRGRFRADLFHRLNEFHINLPPLRERKEDIVILSKCYLDQSNHELNKKVGGFSAEAMKFFLNHDWPGNVRELRNTVRRAVLLTESGDILPNCLPSDIINKPREDSRKTLSLLQGEFDLTKTLDEDGSFKDIIEKVEQELIRSALDQARGRKTEAAKILRMSRKALYRKMKSLGL